jgi:outer membrane protein assembly factor BamA
MKHVVRSVLIMAVSGTLFANPQFTPAAVNANFRYVIEKVEFSGAQAYRFSRSLRESLNALVGSNYDETLLEQISNRIRVELNAKEVQHKIQKGSIPDKVVVVFEVVRRRVELDVSVPRFLYHSRQGWTGQAEGALVMGAHRAAFGVLSDNDSSVERNTGLYSYYEKRNLVSSRASFRFQFDSLRQRWNPATLHELETNPLPLVAENRADEVPETYRTRQGLTPELAFAITRDLTVSAGVSFQYLEMQFPAARTESSNAVKTTLRYHRQWEGSDAQKQVLDAGYTLRAATKVLGSDFVYARHFWEAAYNGYFGHHVLLVQFTAGTIGGRPPIFERFIAGNSNTLRGWNKFDIAPAGATRLVHNTVEYRYRLAYVFYDTGAVWNPQQDATDRHSVGGGLRKDNLFLAVAFPLRDGRVEPIWMAGMNF